MATLAPYAGLRSVAPELRTPRLPGDDLTDGVSADSVLVGKILLGRQMAQMLRARPRPEAARKPTPDFVNLLPGEFDHRGPVAVRVGAITLLVLSKVLRPGTPRKVRRAVIGHTSRTVTALHSRRARADERLRDEDVDVTHMAASKADLLVASAPRCELEDSPVNAPEAPSSHWSRAWYQVVQTANLAKVADFVFALEADRGQPTFRCLFRKWQLRHKVTHVILQLRIAVPRAVPAVAGRSNAHCILSGQGGL